MNLATPGKVRTARVYLQGLDEAFVYTIFQGSQDRAISNWLEKQPDKVKQLEELVDFIV